MDDLVYEAVIPTLFRLIPEAKDAYEAWNMPDEPLPYIVFGFLEESLFPPPSMETEILICSGVCSSTWNGWPSAAIPKSSICFGSVCLRRGPHDHGYSPKLSSAWGQ